MFRYILIVLSLFTVTVRSAATPQNTVGIKTLVVGSDSKSVIIAENVISGYGAAFDVFLGGDLPDLSVDQDYHSVIAADDSVDLEPLRYYCSRTNSRLVVLHSVKQSTDEDVLGVSSISFPSSNITVSSKKAGRSIAGVLNKSGNWDISETDPTAVKIVDSSRVVPVLVYTSSSSKVAAFVSKTSFNTEELHFRFNAGLGGILDGEDGKKFDIQYDLPTEYTQANLAFGHALFEWVTRGIFLGYRRMSFNLHVDDWFINSGIRYTGESWRIGRDDVEAYVDWRERVHTSLFPVGSDFKLEPAYNGAGIAMQGYTDDSLLDSTEEHADQFYWISHTWTHMNMDWLEDGQCNGQHKTCHPTAEIYDAEFSYNHMVAEGVAIPEYIDLYKNRPPTPANTFLKGDPELLKNNYSPTSLVTPEISGLWPADYQGKPDNGRKPYPKNSLFFDRLTANHIWNVVGDNSRPELVPEDLYHGITSTEEQYGTNGVLIIPRFGPNIPYNCKEMDCIAQAYEDGACSWIKYGPPCDGHRYSGPEVITREAKASTIPLLQLKLDPYMFHQANVHAVSDGKGKKVPIISQFAEQAIQDTMRYVDGLPIVSKKMDDLAWMYRNRMKRDRSDVQGRLILNSSGVPVEIEVSGSNDFEAVVSLSRSSGLAFTGESNVESYGPDSTCFKDTSGGSTTFSLTPA